MSTLHPSLNTAILRRNLGKVILFVLLGIFAFLQIFPLLWVFSYSLQKTGDLFGPVFFSIPTHPVWGNFTRAWNDGHIFQYAINSVIIVGVSVVVSTFLSFCMAYATTRMSWKLRGLVFAFATLGMVIPIHATLLPNFIWFNYFGLINTHLGVIIPYVTFTLSFNVLVFSSMMQTLPKEMEESAFIDGASYPTILSRIIAPLTTPAIMTVVIMTFIGNWNEFIMANTYLSSDELRTLPFSIIRFQGQYSSDYAVQFACMTLVALPCLLLYFVFSKWIMGGVTAGAIKG